MRAWRWGIVACLLALPSAAGAQTTGLDLRLPAAPGSLLADRADVSYSMMRQPAPSPARRLPALRRMRVGTISLGGQMSYGLVRGTSELNDHFDHGLGYAFRFRYIVAPRVSLGFSFENQRFGNRIAGTAAAPAGTPADSQLVVTTVGSEAMIFFHRDRVWTPYVLAGAGYASPNVVYGESQSRRLNEGPYLVAGGGIEKFVRPRISFDLTVRGYAQIGNSELSLFSQACLGIHLYPGD